MTQPVECIFCRIVAGEVPTELVYDSAQVVAFRDIAPLTPIHIVIIPRRHIASMNDMCAEDTALLGEMLLAGTQLAREHGIADSGYKLLIRTGQDGGQEVPHVHLHLLGGARMSEGICAV